MIICCDIGQPTRAKLRLCVDLLVNLNMDFLKHSRMHVPALYASGVRYRREPMPGRGRRVERFAVIPSVMRVGFGDCEDLAAWRIAELRLRGVRAVPWIIQPQPKVFHVQVRHPDRTIEDPSLRLGMRGPG